MTHIVDAGRMRRRQGPCDAPADLVPDDAGARTAALAISASSSAETSPIKAMALRAKPFNR